MRLLILMLVEPARRITRLSYLIHALTPSTYAIIAARPVLKAQRAANHCNDASVPCKARPFHLVHLHQPKGGYL